MALPTNIYANVTTYFPGTIQAGDGITVTQVGNVWTIALNTSGIPLGSIDLDKLEDIPTDRLLGRDEDGTGPATSIALGGGLEWTGSGSFQTAAITGDVTIGAGATSAVIPANTITFTQMADISTNVLIGRDTASSGDPEEISVSGGLGFTGSAGLEITDNGVTFAKIVDIDTARILGRTTAGSGDPEAMTGTQATALLNTVATDTKGLAPGPTSAEVSNESYLKADGTWDAAMPVGTVLMRAIKTAPTGWLKCNGAAVSRTTYSRLWDALKIEDSTVDTTSSSATVTMDDTSDLEVGYAIEGAGIPTGTTISSVDSGTQITISQNATATASNITATFIPTPFGPGDGSTTFDLPELRAEFPRFWDDGRGQDSGRVFGSTQADDIESHTHPSPAAGDYFTIASGSQSLTTGAGSLQFPTASATGATGGTETRPRNVALLGIIKT